MTVLRGRLAGMLLACLLAPSVACSADPAAGPQPAPSPTSSSRATASSSAEPLRLAVYGVPAAVAAYEEAARAFTEETGVAVDVEVHRGAAATASWVRDDLEASGRAPDVFLLDHEFLPDILTTGRLQHVDEALEERGLQFGDGYQRTALTAFSAEDVLQCMPVDMSPRVLFVNREHVRPRDLAIRGVPLPEKRQWDWEAFDAAARVIAREHQGEADFHAVHLPLEADVVTALVRSAGGEVVDDVDRPTTLTLDSDEAREVLQAYAALARQDAVVLSEEEASQRSPLARFGRGELAMMVGTRADVPALRESGVPFDVMPLPSFGSPRTVADIAGLCVDRHSDRLEAALDLVAFLAGNQGSAILARSGAVVPANLDVAFSPVLDQRGQRPRSVQTFEEALKRSGYMPFSTSWREVAGLVEGFVSELVAGQRKVERVLDRRLPRLDERSQTLLDGALGGDSDELAG